MTGGCEGREWGGRRNGRKNPDLSSVYYDHSPRPKLKSASSDSKISFVPVAIQFEASKTDISQNIFWF